MCHVLGVSRSGYYAWRQRPPSQREIANQVLIKHIREVFERSRQTYGSPRVHAELRRREIICSRHRVARLMCQHGLVARKRRGWHPVTTRRQVGVPVAPNLLNQDFRADRPHQKWVADLTYIDTDEGWLYLAVVLDIYSRKAVGWAMADHMRSSVVEDALQMALWRCHPDPGLLHHSDQGSQYTGFSYQCLLAEFNSQVSMSRAGNCYDNALMESFFSTLKTECVTDRLPSHAAARLAIFEFIEVWYNRQRLHSSLGYLSPEDFEHRYFDKISVH
jgi:putative transposase